MQIEESTKPYLYYEQIINGLFVIPKRIQTYLGNAILVRNEQHRIELEKQKKADAINLSIVEEKEETDTNEGLFKLPLFGWFSSSNNKVEAPAELVESKGNVDTPAELEESNENVQTPAELVESKENVETLGVLEESKGNVDTPAELVESNDNVQTPAELVESKEILDTPAELEESKEILDTPGELEESKGNVETPGEQVESKEFVQQYIDKNTLDQESPATLDKTLISSGRCNIRNWKSKLE